MAHKLTDSQGETVRVLQNPAAWTLIYPPDYWPFRGGEAAVHRRNLTALCRKGMLERFIEEDGGRRVTYRVLPAMPEAYQEWWQARGWKVCDTNVSYLRDPLKGGA